VFSRFPGGNRLYGCSAPPIAPWAEDGFSSCSTCPCHRAAPNHPAGVPVRFGQPALCHASPRSRGLGPRSHIFSRPPLGSLTLRPGDSLTIPKMASSVGFIRFVSSSDATQATKVLTLPPVGLTPTEHASLSWTHCFANIPSGVRITTPDVRGNRDDGRPFDIGWRDFKC